MGHFKSVVMDYLQANGAMFVNTQFCMRLDKPGDPEKPGHICSCDAVAIDLRHGAVYLCETAFENKFGSLIKKLSAWTKNWESIKRSIRVNCRVPADWRIHVWLFVPKDLIETLDGELDSFIKAYLTCRMTGEWPRSGAAEDAI